MGQFSICFTKRDGKNEYVRKARIAAVMSLVFCNEISCVVLAKTNFMGNNKWKNVTSSLLVIYSAFNKEFADLLPIQTVITQITCCSD